MRLLSMGALRSRKWAVAACGIAVAVVATSVTAATAIGEGKTTAAEPSTISASLSARTFPGTWDWTGSTIKGFSTPTPDQTVTVSAEGLTSANRNAAALLRYASDSNTLRMKVSGTEVALEDGQRVLKSAARPGDAATSVGVLEVTVVGNLLTAKWNGKEALTHTLTKVYPGKHCGVQVWQDVAASVKVAATCKGTGAAAAPVTPTTVAPAPTPSSTTTAVPATTSTTAKPPVTVTAPPSPSNPNDPTPGWLSGAAGPDASRGGFAAWRGSPVEIGGTWINDPAVYTLAPGGELFNFRGPVDVGISPPDWQGWQAEANGVHDNFYRQMFTSIKNARAGKGTVYVRPWYEFNGNWMTYSVPPGQEAVFKSAWIRMAGIARSVFPEVKLVYCASAAHGSNVYSAFPGKQYVDVGGIDFYNNYPFVTTQAGFDDKILNGGGAYSMEKLRQFYQSQGVPFAVNEWSNQGARRSVAEGGGGESPQFIRSIHDYFKKHAGTGPGQLVYEVQFNLWPDQFQFFPANQTVQPQTAAEYARLF